MSSKKSGMPNFHKDDFLTTSEEGAKHLPNLQNVAQETSSITPEEAFELESAKSYGKATRLTSESSSSWADIRSKTIKTLRLQGIIVKRQPKHLARSYGDLNNQITKLQNLRLAQRFGITETDPERIITAVQQRLIKNIDGNESEIFKQVTQEIHTLFADFFALSEPNHPEGDKSDSAKAG